MIFFFPYTLKLLAPVVITGFGGDPNSATTLRYISGSSLRGVVAGKLGDPQDDAERNARFKRLITSGQVCYLNAYPLTLTQKRSLPVPASLRLQKYRRGGTDECVVDLSYYDIGSWPDKQLIGLDAPFVNWDSEIHTVPVSCSSRIHHQRDRTKGRPTKERGALFIYESIDPEQSFMGYVAVNARDKEVAKDQVSDIANLVGEGLLLGRSKLAGYGGKAAFSVDLSNPREREYEGNQVWDKGLGKSDKFRVVLLSDYIGRDPLSGQVDPASFVPRLLQSLDHKAKVIHQHWKFAYAGGFNRKARLPLPVTATLAAGSVIILEATADIPHQDLLNIEARGLGERRPEGFGRFSFWKPASSGLITRQFPKPGQPDQPSAELPQEAKDTLETIQQRLLQTEMESIILAYTHRCTKGITNPPSASLLGRLRVPLRSSPPEAVDTLANWTYTGDDKTKLKSALAGPARRQLRRCVLGGPEKGKTLGIWLQEITSTDNHRIGDRLNFKAVADTYHLVSPDNAGKILDDLSEALRVRLIDAVLGEIMRCIRQKGGE